MHARPRLIQDPRDVRKGLQAGIQPKIMLSPRIVQTLFTAVALLFAFTLLNRALTSDDGEKYGTYEATDLDTPKAQPYSQGSSFITHVTEKVSPWLPGGNSLGQHIKKNEVMYNEMLEQRKELYKDYEKTPDPVNKNLFPCRGGDDYWRTPFSIWDFMPASWNCPHTNRRLGRLGDGGKWLCGLERLISLPRSRKSKQPPNEINPAAPATAVTGLKPGDQPGCVIYSFGIQFESTFEEELIKRTPSCQIWGYDFSVDKFGPALKGFEAQNRAHFVQAGIAGKTDIHAAPAFYSIQDLMQINGHDHIDVLKMDIEGYEFEAMRSVVEHFLSKGEEVPIAQFLVEIHLMPDQIGVDDFIAWWELLEKAGFRPVWTEPNLLVNTLKLHDGMPRYAEYSMLNIKDRKSPFL